MRNIMKMAAVAVVCASTMVACGPGGLNNEQGGALTGAALGGLVGNQFGHGSGRALATIGGAVAGTFLGSRVGKSMDRTDQLQVQQSMASGRTNSWQSANGNRYHVNPNGTYITQDGRMCRHFTLTDNTGARLSGTACCKQLQHGRCTSWKIVK